jgi:hypothetical protein
MSDEKKSGSNAKPGSYQWHIHASEIEAMIGCVFDPYSPNDDNLNLCLDWELSWIAENPKHPDTPERASDWLRAQMELGRSDPAGRLSRAIKSGKVGIGSKTHVVLFAIAAYLRENHRWPSDRDEINIPEVSTRTRDMAFEVIKEQFGVEIDGRERWNPQ